MPTECIAEQFDFGTVGSRFQREFGLLGDQGGAWDFSPRLPLKKR